jgi:hypothetical protein
MMGRRSIRLAFYRQCQSREAQGGNSTTKAMSDKNPKAKRKLQAQHELQKQQKAQQALRDQERMHDAHSMKHPHDPKG